MAGPLELVLHGPTRRPARRRGRATPATGRSPRACGPPRCEPTLGRRRCDRGRWHLSRTRRATTTTRRLAHVVLALRCSPACRSTHDGRPQALHARPAPRGGALLIAERDLDDDERGRYHQRRLRLHRLLGPPGERRCVTPSSTRASGGAPVLRQPARRIHEELVRRGAPLEHLWVVHDGQAAAPGHRHRAARRQPRAPRGAGHRALRRLQRPPPRLLPPARGPDRPADLARDAAQAARARRREPAPTQRRFEHRWSRRGRQLAATWSPPTRYTTPILRRALAVEGEIHETGYPRNDVLAAAGPGGARARGCASASACPRASGSCSTRRPSATTSSTAAAARPRPASRRRPAARRGGRRHRGAVPQAPPRRSTRVRRRPTASSATSPPSPTAPSCCWPPTCWSPTTRR